MNIFNFNGYRLLKSDLNTVPLTGKILINTLSPNSYGISVKDEQAKQALKGSDVLILDGLYFGLAPLLLKFRRIKRITGWDSFVHFSARVNDIHGKVLFLGSTTDTLLKIKDRYKFEYPNVQVDTISPPFKAEFSKSDDEEIIQKINIFKPDVLFIGMTAPKQEKWGFKNKEFLDVKIISTIGNVFDWYAGNSKRPGKIWINLGLEWFARIFYRPEIFKRNTGNQMLFLWHLLLALLFIKKFQ